MDTSQRAFGKMPDSHEALPHTCLSSLRGAIPFPSQPCKSAISSLANLSGMVMMMTSSVMVKRTPIHWICEDRSPLLRATLNPKAAIVVRIMARMLFRSFRVPCRTQKLSSR